MNEIKLHVDDKNLQTILTILENLKNGLVEDIQVNSTSNKAKIPKTKYQPKTNKIIKEEDSGTSDKNGKYMSASAYKQRMKK